MGTMVNRNAASATAHMAVKQCFEGTDGGTYMYVQANGAIAAGDWVGIDEDGQAAKLTTAMAGDGWRIGVAPHAFTDDYYGGIAIANVTINAYLLASCAADVALYTTATAGRLDDTVDSTLVKIEGVVNTTVVDSASALSEIIMTYPRSASF